MIKVLFDIDVILDVLEPRKDFYLDSFSILNLCDLEKIEGWISADSHSTIHYFLRKELDEFTSRERIVNNLKSLSTIPVRNATLVNAFESKNPDFEDNLKIASAQEFHLNFIVTRNTSHYKNSAVEALTPQEFMNRYKSEKLLNENTSVPFLDLKAQHHQIYNDIDDKATDIIVNTAFILGKHVEEFEQNFAEICGANHCIGVGNGTDALLIALKCMGIGQGDEIIVPANTFIATSEAVTMVGARVVFIDCDPDTYNIDVNLIESRITSRTKAIIPVHLYGQPANMPAIYRIAKKHGLKIIQDCAQAHGAEIDGKSLASFGDVLCFSFYPGKNLGAYGDAGAIVPNDEEVATRARMFSNHGRISKYDHEFEGINSRMDEIQGAVLNVKLKYLPEWTKKRQEAATLYDELLYNVGDIVTPYCSSNVKHVYHLYVIRSKNRDALRGHLEDRGIATSIHYPTALPFLKAYNYLEHKPEDFPVAYKYQNEILSLPMYPELSHESICFISDEVQNFWKKRK